MSFYLTLKPEPVHSLIYLGKEGTISNDFAKMCDLDGFERKITLCNGAKQSLENPLIDFLRSASLVVFHGKKYKVVIENYIDSVEDRLDYCKIKIQLKKSFKKIY